MRNQKVFVLLLVAATLFLNGCGASAYPAPASPSPQPSGAQQVAPNPNTDPPRMMSNWKPLPIPGEFVPNAYAGEVAIVFYAGLCQEILVSDGGNGNPITQLIPLPSNLACRSK